MAMTDNTTDIKLLDTDGGGLRFDLGGGYTLTLNFTSAAMRLRIDAEKSGEWYAETLDRDFFESRQKRSRVANEAEGEIPSASADWISTRFREIAEYINEYKPDMMADEARGVLNRTEAVKAYQSPEELTIAVWLSAPSESPVDGTRRLEFDGSVFQANQSDALEEEHFRAFVAPIDLANDDWESLRDEWLDSLNLEQSETQSADDIIADRVTDVLAKQLSNKLFDDKEALLNGDKTAYYECADDSTHDEATVWVQSPAIKDVVEQQTDKSWAEYSGVLSRTLKRHGITLGSSSRRRVPNGRATMWPFAAEELNVGEIDVQQYGSSDSDDGGDELEIEE